MITPEQEDFLYRILTIPFEERLWKALVTLVPFMPFMMGVNLHLKPDDSTLSLKLVSFILCQFYF